MNIQSVAYEHILNDDVDLQKSNRVLSKRLLNVYSADDGNDVAVGQGYNSNNNIGRHNKVIPAATTTSPDEQNYHNIKYIKVEVSENSILPGHTAKLRVYLTNLLNHPAILDDTAINGRLLIHTNKNSLHLNYTVAVLQPHHALEYELSNSDFSKEMEVLAAKRKGSVSEMFLRVFNSMQIPIQLVDQHVSIVKEECDYDLVPTVYNYARNRRTGVNSVIDVPIQGAFTVSLVIGTRFAVGKENEKEDFVPSPICTIAIHTNLAKHHIPILLHQVPVHMHSDISPDAQNLVANGEEPVSFFVTNWNMYPVTVAYNGMDTRVGRLPAQMAQYLHSRRAAITSRSSKNSPFGYNINVSDLPFMYSKWLEHLRWRTDVSSLNESSARFGNAKNITSNMTYRRLLHRLYALSSTVQLHGAPEEELSLSTTQNDNDNDNDVKKEVVVQPGASLRFDIVDDRPDNVCTTNQTANANSLPEEGAMVTTCADHAVPYDQYTRIELNNTEIYLITVHRRPVVKRRNVNFARSIADSSAAAAAASSSLPQGRVKKINDENIPSEEELYTLYINHVEDLATINSDNNGFSNANANMNANTLMVDSTITIQHNLLLRCHSVRRKDVTPYVSLQHPLMTLDTINLAKLEELDVNVVVKGSISMNCHSVDGYGCIMDWMEHVLQRSRYAGWDDIYYGPSSDDNDLLPLPFVQKGGIYENPLFDNDMKSNRYDIYSDALSLSFTECRTLHKLYTEIARLRSLFSKKNSTVATQPENLVQIYRYSNSIQTLYHAVPPYIWIGNGTATIHRSMQQGGPIVTHVSTHVGLPRIAVRHEGRLEFETTHIGTTQMQYVDIVNPSEHTIVASLTMLEQEEGVYLVGVDKEEEWWHGGHYWMHTPPLLQTPANNNVHDHDHGHGELLRATHNITILSQSSASINLVSPSLQTCTSLTHSCGKRCNLRTEVPTNQANLAQIASGSVVASWENEQQGFRIGASNGVYMHSSTRTASGQELVHKGEFIPAFAIPLTAIKSQIIPRGGTARLGPILFRPPGRGEYKASIGISSGYNGVEVLKLTGDGGHEELLLTQILVDNSGVVTDDMHHPVELIMFEDRQTAKYLKITNSGTMSVTFTANLANGACRDHNFILQECYVEGQYSDVSDEFVSLDVMKKVDKSTMPFQSLVDNKFVTLKPGQSTQLTVVMKQDCVFSKVFTKLILGYKRSQKFRLNSNIVEIGYIDRGNQCTHVKQRNRYLRNRSSQALFFAIVALYVLRLQRSRTKLRSGKRITSNSYRAVIRCLSYLDPSAAQLVDLAREQCKYHANKFKTKIPESRGPPSVRDLADVIFLGAKIESKCMGSNVFSKKDDGKNTKSDRRDGVLPIGLNWRAYPKNIFSTTPSDGRVAKLLKSRKASNKISNLMNIQEGSDDSFDEERDEISVASSEEDVGLLANVNNNQGDHPPSPRRVHFDSSLFVNGNGSTTGEGGEFQKVGSKKVSSKSSGGPSNLVVKTATSKVARSTQSHTRNKSEASTPVVASAGSNNAVPVRRQKIKENGANHRRVKSHSPKQKASTWADATSGGSKSAGGTSSKAAEKKYPQAAVTTNNDVQKRNTSTKTPSIKSQSEGKSSISKSKEKMFGPKAKTTKSKSTRAVINDDEPLCPPPGLAPPPGFTGTASPLPSPTSDRKNADLPIAGSSFASGNEWPSIGANPHAGVNSVFGAVGAPHGQINSNFFSQVSNSSDEVEDTFINMNSVPSPLELGRQSSLNSRMDPTFGEEISSMGQELQMGFSWGAHPRDHANSLSDFNVDSFLSGVLDEDNLGLENNLRLGDGVENNNKERLSFLQSISNDDIMENANQRSRIGSDQVSPGPPLNWDAPASASLLIGGSTIGPGFGAGNNEQNMQAPLWFSAASGQSSLLYQTDDDEEGKTDGE